MIRKPIKKPVAVALGVCAILLMGGGYTYMSYRQHQENPDDTTIPSWSQLKEGIVTIVSPHKRTGERWVIEDSEATFVRFGIGMLWGVIGALVLGILMGCYKPIEAMLAPPLSMLAKIPPTAMLAVFFVLVGTDQSMFVAMIAFGILPTLAESVYLSVKDVPDELLFKAQTLGASQGEIIWNVIVRHALPKLIDSVRLQIGPAMVFLIAAEMVVGDVGFGYRIRLQSRLMNMSVVYPYLALLMGFGFSMNWSLKSVQRLLCPWYADRREA